MENTTNCTDTLNIHVETLVLGITIGFLSVVFNALLTLSILRSEELREKAFHVWVLALSMSDILFGIVIVATNPAFEYMLEIVWRPRFAFMQYYNNCLSSFLFLGLNIDRALAIVKPMEAHVQQSRKSIKAKVIFYCILALVPSLPVLLIDYDHRCLMNCSYFVNCSKEVKTRYMQYEKYRNNDINLELCY